MIIIFTPAEIEAARLLYRAGCIPLDNSVLDIHQLANIVIELAERIKAERAVVAMSR